MAAASVGQSQLKAQAVGESQRRHGEVPAERGGHPGRGGGGRVPRLLPGEKGLLEQGCAIGLLALAVNLGVAGLLYQYRGADSQALSVWLCTRNDCIANIAVMLAGAGVWASATAWPDIAVAAIIACLGLSSAVRVIRQALLEMRVPGIARGVPAE